MTQCLRQQAMLTKVEPHRHAHHALHCPWPQCDTHYIAHVKDACAFLGPGMSRIETLESRVHGRCRDLNNEDEVRFGVTSETFYARNRPGVEGAQWTGIVTQIGPKDLEFGKYSINYHTIRNYLYVTRTQGPKRAAQHIPEYAKKIVEEYDTKGEVAARLKLPYNAPPPTLEVKKARSYAPASVSGGAVSGKTQAAGAPVSAQ